MRVKNSVELELMGYQTVINAGFEVFYGSYLQIDASWRCGGALWTYLSRLFPWELHLFDCHYLISDAVSGLCGCVCVWGEKVCVYGEGGWEEEYSSYVCSWRDD